MPHHEKYYRHVYSLHPGRHSGEFIEFAKLDAHHKDGYEFMNDKNTIHLHEAPYLLILDFFYAVNPKLESQYDQDYLGKKDLEKIINLFAEYKAKLEACKKQENYEALHKELYSNEILPDEAEDWKFISDGMIKVSQDLIDFFAEAITEKKLIYVYGI